MRYSKFESWGEMQPSWSLFHNNCFQALPSTASYLESVTSASVFELERRGLADDDPPAPKQEIELIQAGSTSWRQRVKVTLNQGDRRRKVSVMCRNFERLAKETKTVSQDTRAWMAYVVSDEGFCCYCRRSDDS